MFGSRTTLSRFMDFHRGLGVTSGLVVYIIVITGCFSVFAERLGAWAERAPPAKSLDFKGLTSALLDLQVAQADRAHGVWQLTHTSSGALAAAFLTDNTDEKHFLLSPLMRVVVQNELVPATESSKPVLAVFYSKLHIGLNLPEPWGSVLTGLAGMSLLLGALSGLVLHRRLFKEIFRAPWRGSMNARRRTMHTTIAAWSVPFTLLIGFTGSLLSFSSAIGLPMVAILVFHGDQSAVFSKFDASPTTRFEGTPLHADAVERAIQNAQDRVGSNWSNVKIDGLGDIGSSVTVSFATVPGNLFGKSLLYNGATGTFVNELPILGSVPSTSGALYQALANLHYGRFAGIVSEILWATFGLALAQGLRAGIDLWIARHRDKDMPMSLLARIAPAIFTSVPFGLCLVLIVYPLSTMMHANPAADIAVAAAIGVVLPGFWVAGEPLKRARRLVAATGVVLMLAPITGGLAGHYSTWRAWNDGAVNIVATDAALFVLGVLLIWRSWLVLNSSNQGHQFQAVIAKFVRSGNAPVDERL